MSELLDNFAFAYSQYPLLLYISILLLGLATGSFLNVVICRLPVMIERELREVCEEFSDKSPPASPEKFNLVVPRSHCPNCGHKIKAWENIPLLSYLLLRGRCSECGAAISLQYPAVELITGVLSVWLAVHFGPDWRLPAALVLTWALIALSVIDLKEGLLPDDITLPFLWLGLLFSLSGFFTTPADAIIGGAAGYLSLWLVYHAFKLVTGKEGMGYGDFKLLAMLGAWMGWQSLPMIIILSSFVGAVVGLALIAFTGRDHQIPIPFGPYLAVAGWIYLLYGDTILQIYSAWLGPANTI